LFAVGAGVLPRHTRILDQTQVVLLLGQLELGLVAFFKEAPEERLGCFNFLLENAVLYRLLILLCALQFRLFQRRFECAFVAYSALEIGLQFFTDRFAGRFQLLSEGCYLLVHLDGLRVLGTVIDVELCGSQRELTQLFLQL
jgi:hypothetical protein